MGASGTVLGKQMGKDFATAPVFCKGRFAPVTRRFAESNHP
jgi:hypothetical protein